MTETKEIDGLTQRLNLYLDSQEKRESFTQDYHMLPSSDRIKELINEDAEKRQTK